jgi:hypothetical protein
MSRLGTGVHRPDRHSRPGSHARRAARRSGNRARCHRRRRVTARRPSSHLQSHTGRSPAQSNMPRASAASTGPKRPVNSARRGGVLGGSTGQWPSMELAGRARAQGARSAHAFKPVRPARSSGNKCAPGGDMAARALLHDTLGTKASNHKWSSHGVGGPGGMSGPRAPHERDAAVLRLEGRQPGKATRRRTPTSSVQNRVEFKEGGKG